MSPLFKLNREVEAALAEDRAIVALESTVIAHGLPRPQNLETAQRLEQLVRSAGAVPATIAILKGYLHVGLNTDQLEHIAQSEDVHKISRRDLPVAVAKRWDGATTVATTALIAERAGIKVFATGGIGGVHRGELPDVSADLPELAPQSGRRLFRREDSSRPSCDARVVGDARHHGRRLRHKRDACFLFKTKRPAR